jgi:hypothetical protein
MTEDIVRVLHTVLAGVWLGGVLFTTAVVSPALRAMDWPEAHRVSVRSVIGRHYAPLAMVNLALLAIFALWDSLISSPANVHYAEWAAISALFALTAAHGAYLGPRLGRLAQEEGRAANPKAAAAFAGRRRALQRLSVRISWVNLGLSVAVALLAAAG